MYIILPLVVIRRRKYICPAQYGAERVVWLVVAGSCPDQNKTFSILFSLVNMFTIVTIYYWVTRAGLLYTRQRHWPHYVRLRVTEYTRSVLSHSANSPCVLSLITAYYMGPDYGNYICGTTSNKWIYLTKPLVFKEAFFFLKKLQSFRTILLQCLNDNLFFLIQI